MLRDSATNLAAVKQSASSNLTEIGGFGAVIEAYSSSVADSSHNDVCGCVHVGPCDSELLHPLVCGVVRGAFDHCGFDFDGSDLSVADVVVVVEDDDVWVIHHVVEEAVGSFCFEGDLEEFVLLVDYAAQLRFERGEIVVFVEEVEAPKTH